MKSVDTIGSILSFKGPELWFVAPSATVYEAIQKMSEKGWAPKASWTASSPSVITPGRSF
jgi:hypothetical protein